MLNIIPTQQLKRFVIVSCFVILCSSAAIAKADLVIKISDSRSNESYTYLPEIKVYRNGLFFMALTPEHEKTKTIKQLELGSYTLTYTSLFQQEVRLTVAITKDTTYSINVYTNYLDYSQETYIPVIDQLQVNEHYSIFFSSNGCFHSTRDTIIIKRTSEGYHLNWGDQSKKLNANDIEAIRHFELELNYMDVNGCTTTDNYTIRYRNKRIKHISDGSCNWRGAYYLKKQLFP